jgi:hypothetical protein
MLLAALLVAAATSASPLDRPRDPEVIRPGPVDNRPECRQLRAQIRAAEPARKELLAGRGRPGATKLVMRSLTMQNGCVVAPPEEFHPAYLLPGRADAPQYRPVADDDAAP